LLDVLANQMALLRGQPSIPSSQQLIERRAVLPAGAHDKQHAETTLKLATSA